MTSFESIDRLCYRRQTPPPEFLDGAAPTYRQRAHRNRRQKRAPEAMEDHQTRCLAEDTAATRQLTQAQRMESISRVTGGIAHNFNNLLTGIIGSCHLLKDGCEEPDADDSYLANILGSANHAAELVKQLLAFSQQQILEPKSLDVNLAVTRCEPLVRRMAGEHVEMVIDLEPAPGTVRADPRQIERVISSLAANAVEAMAEGGRLILRTRHLEIDGFSISDLGIPRGCYVLLEVEDTGTGIDEAIYDRIFEPFFSTKEDLNGTGLGLSVVYGLVKQSSGQIRVESSPGRGTRFRIYLPRIDPEPEMAPDPTSVPDPTARDQPANRRQTILLAEDDPAIQLVLKAFLAKQGYQVLAAGDGVEGFELSERYDGEIDLLLTDIVMPRMNGLELAQAMLSQRADTKVLFISGYTQEREVLCELLGGPEVDFLKKPFENECLELRLRALLDPVRPRRLPRAAA